ncbi:MAG TPA: NAD(P)H-dependent oxidoreductase [Thermoanaerobaculia bacterium]|nr:NAD(P)H-dependent oxidoreductase [Thermoanaerobaculia bacterium]
MKIIAISGSLRARSSNLTLLRAAASIASGGMEVAIYDGLASLPHFNPDDDEEGAIAPAPVAALRALLASADGILISTPEYAHGLPGSLKNALDWLVSDGALVDKPVAILSASPIGGQFAQASLVEILTTMNWRVLGTWTAPTKVRDANVSEQVAAVIREALAAVTNSAT